ncbi:unnamed protein product (macronuclear) [Paramecium tetraurelia]|uniref:Protein kinase domain-containing protein n=1 Tax=Paramecium tetraurelia TaxID=5888 RepID=A0C626_PARTE|nr:uncharacterized protein GSPATT00035372001 [Paramecium tetraurelia]CAK66243.1 unnamed protein product [Paramecium tetraurelia]|eukprot:XP_001433640.1 hypothetical protein (macronuclear) [Paramecium tetraurelia strain d4-2]
MNQQSLLVEKNLIYRLFEKDNIIGKGKDLIHGISSSIYKLKKNNHVTSDFNGEWGWHALQIYENLNLEVFETKVIQLQKAMTTHLNPYSTRIILIGKEQVHQQQFNLHVVYEFGSVNDDFKSMRDQKEGLDDEEATNFLSFLCHNYMLGSQFTNEFLDISPQNIFFTDQSYIVSNFGITYAGTKFHRSYLPITDPILKEKKPSKINILYSYAFRAGLLVLTQMTQIDPKDLFFEDGQFKEQLLDNILYLIQDGDEKEKRKDKKFITQIPQFFDTLTHSREQDYNEQKAKNQGKQFKYVKSQRFLQHKYRKEFLDILKKLLNVNNIQSRSIFQLLIAQPENILQVQAPYDERSEDKYNYSNGTIENNKLNGCGIISIDKGDEKGKQKNVELIQMCGRFENGEVSDAFNIITIHNIKYECKMFHLQCDLEFRYVYNELLYLNEEIVSPINPIGKLKKETIYYFKGQIEEGQFKQGISYQLDNTIFEGEFKNNQPYEGTLTYPNQEVFEGTMDGFNKKKGRLVVKGRTYDGQFMNDQFFKGHIEYEDGGVFYGNFKNGQKVKAGVYQYPNSQIQYQGLYADDLRHGKGQFIDRSKENCVQEVVYNYGLCETKLIEHFEKALKEIQEKQKQQKSLKKQGQQEEDNDEEIEEDIEENPGDDNEDGDEG